ncbi:MAG: hypothetical protein KF718_07405 [Polyangiaceae bacterium]|nr:hypothetical protein [Polyangiaceae bacterium]
MRTGSRAERIAASSGFWGRALALLCLAGLLVTSLVTLATPAGAQEDSSTNLLAGRLPIRSAGVPRAERLTDGLAATFGDHWKTDRTAVFHSTGSFVEFDLGEVVALRAAYLLADNNDTYSLSVSKDGEAWSPLWEAGPASGRGLQPRTNDRLDAEARYLRITASAGDASYAISEVQVFSAKPEPFPPFVPSRPGIPPDERLRNLALTFGLALAAFALVAYRGAPIWWLLLTALLPLFAGWELASAVQDDWPVGQREVAILRGMVALTAMLVVLREAFAPLRWKANAAATLSVLGICAVIAVACFFNLGRPQYIDHGLQKPSYVHNFDMRVYYPIAKYFKELRYDGLYMGSVAAYVDDDPAVTLDSLSHVGFRDLKTHEMTNVANRRHEIEAVKARFSPERWQAFVEDMRYFRLNMGVRDYLGSMHDHGGNATPVWFTLVHYMYRATTASNETLFLGAMLDPLLLLIGFLAIGRTFGLRTMFVSMILWGANDFYMFGTNWAGATLRHDWMVYLALGLCALKTQRWVLGGALLALAAMIRAFPATGLVILGVVVLWWLVDYVGTHKKRPSLAELRRAQEPFLKIALGATLTVVVLLGISSAVLSFGAWSEWLDKVHLLNRDPHVNHVSWRGLVAGPDGVHNRILRGRTPVYIAGIVFYIVLIALAARRRSIAQTSALGLLLIPIVFHPANYYVHFVFLVPLIAQERGRRSEARALSFGDGMLWASFLGVCAAQYWTVRESDLGLHFHFASALLFGGLTLGLAALLVQDALERSGAARLLEPALAGPPDPVATPPAAELASDQSVAEPAVDEPAPAVAEPAVDEPAPAVAEPAVDEPEPAVAEPAVDESASAAEVPPESGRTAEPASEPAEAAAPVDRASQPDDEPQS